MSLADLTVNSTAARTLGITAATITYRSQAADTLELTVDALATDAPDLTGTITASIGSATFTGTVQKPSRNGSGGGSETHRITAVGKWDDLSRLVLQVDRPFDDYEGLDTRVILGGEWVPDDYSTVDLDPVSRDGLRIDPTPIQDTLDLVATFAGISLAGSSITLKTPPREVDGITCAEAIRSILQWLPGTTASFNGTASTLTITTSGSALSIPLDQIVGVADLHERTDRVLPGVKILFRKLRQSSLGEIEVVTPVTAGTPDAVGAFVGAIELMPEIHQIESANLDIANIEESSRDWWAERDAWVADTIEELGADLVGPTDISVIREHSSLDHELKGSIPDSFKLGCTGPIDPTARVITVGNLTRPKVGEIRVRATFTIGADTTYTRAQKFVREIPLLGTSLNNSSSADAPSLFAREDKLAYDPGEDPAEYSAIPAAILAASAALAYDGSVTYLPSSIPASVIGRRLQLPGIVSDTGVPVFEQSIDCVTGLVTLRFGAPDYLGARDLIELLRVLRETRRQRPLKSKREPDGGTRRAPEQSPQRPTRPPAPANRPPVEYGNITVQITPPEAVTAGATWYATGGGQREIKGPFTNDEIVKLPVGDYIITFMPAPGWQAPKPVTGIEISTASSIVLDGDDAEYTELAAAVERPLDPVIREKTDGSGTPLGTYELKVTTGYLLESTLPTSQVSITGLDTWTDISIADAVVWLEIAHLSTFGDIDSATIEIGDSFDPTLAPWVPDSILEDDGEDPPQHVLTRVPLGQITVVSGVPVVRPLCGGNLMLRATDVAARPCLFPFPSPYGGWITA